MSFRALCGTTQTQTCKPHASIYKSAREVAYASKRSRVGAIVSMGFGERYSQTSIIGTYEVEMQRGVIDWYAGGGIGFGSQSWRETGRSAFKSHRTPHAPASPVSTAPTSKRAV